MYRRLQKKESSSGHFLLGEVEASCQQMIIGVISHSSAQVSELINLLHRICLSKDANKCEGSRFSRGRGRSLARTRGFTADSMVNPGMSLILLWALSFLRIRFLNEHALVASNASGSIMHPNDKAYIDRNRTEAFSHKTVHPPISENAATDRAPSHYADAPCFNPIKAEDTPGDFVGNASRFFRFPSQAGDDHHYGNSYLPASEIDHGRKLLSSMRRWTDILMGIAVEGDRSGPVAEMAEELIRFTDKRYRFLQAMVLESKISLP